MPKPDRPRREDRTSGSSGAWRRDGDRKSGGAQAPRRAGGSTGGTRRSEGAASGGSARGESGPPPGRRRAPGEAARTAPRLAPGPAIDDDIAAGDLDRAVRGQLSSLSGPAAERVARHLLMAGRLLEDDPELALEHARAARAVPGSARVGGVREATGLAAYAAGRYQEALVELRAARRIGGSDELLPVLADSERGVGRPDRALKLAADPGVARLTQAGRAEMLIVSAGAHRDLGRTDRAVVTLRVPALDARKREPWVARLRYAYADALLETGDDAGAVEWFERAAEADAEGETDAAERLGELQGVAFLTGADDDAEDGEAPVDPSTGGPAARSASTDRD